MDVDRRRSGRRVAIALGNALAFSVTGGAQAAAGAREELRDRFGPKLDPEVVGVAQLLLSELINNCVTHGAAGRPGAWIDVTASIFPRALSVAVSDGGPAFERESGVASADAESGRGLSLVEQLASRWGMSERGSARVWFELPRAAPVPALDR
jgi:anti-sigma regulatory factor (Ser/Thr protein kinase)